ncbi:C2H2 transcription factor Swi5 [Talaromyces proteolyticus]|uniref:C2H2 transcription factor Swi5 n=1 Tax=Talaromyces proteolyticus TaxID=1131652 RepID=A0AAD4KMK7_9EURO|nr:C2H2 transcription factor Swi5 [Talaromyces proteolyticus]KAH8692665.1 C2H2 transcription factor Swi5 [Talaromyces proteolyticus]
MLVSPSSNIQRRQRLHRRQNSIPVALEAAKFPNLPAAAMHRYSMHKRGTSLDQRAVNLQPGVVSKDGPTTSYHRHPNVLQETQQQMSRLNQPYFDQSNIHMSSNTDCQQLGPGGLNVFTNTHSNENLVNYACMNTGGFDIELEDFKNRQTKPAIGNIRQQQQQPSKASIAFTNSLETQSMNEESWQISQSGLPQVYDLRRMSVQSDLSQHQYTPSTPPKQIHTNYFPLTPEATPFRRNATLATHGQNLRILPTKNVVYQTAQPMYMQRAKSLQGVPGSNFTEPQIDVPSPPNTAPVDYDSFDLLTSQESDFESTEFQLPSESESFALNDKQHHVQLSSTSTSFQSSPETAYMPLPTASSKTPKVSISLVTPSNSSPQKMDTPSSPESPSKAKLSPRVASIDNLNLDARVQASIAQTGITLDEIASYISGPDPIDGKWVCVHPGCNRRFGRKENIKSHVQTHLGDRQYKCDHCHKCFVRGHDLKRHAKIHTGDKPYECPCGNVFARHDALTRHRQRGMCIGGYTGVVRKTTKRGRPKKNRPDMDERQDKASRTREKIAASVIAPSVSGSDSSCGSPPSDIFETMSIQASSPLDDVTLFDTKDYCMPSDVFTFTPPASPGYSTGNKPSPAQSIRSHSPSSEDGCFSRSPSKQSLEDIPEEIPDLPPISEAAGCFDPEPENAIQRSLASFSSPPPVPALTSPGAGSEIDIFINHDSSFSDFNNGSSFPNDMDLFPSKPAPSMNEDIFLEFTDDQSNDPFF